MSFVGSKSGNPPDGPSRDTDRLGQGQTSGVKEPPPQVSPPEPKPEAEPAPPDSFHAESAPSPSETAKLRAEAEGRPTLPTVLAPEHAILGGPALGGRLGGRYEIRALLGEGGMGAVFLAHDEVLGADIALKLVRQDVISQRDVLERLRAEVLLAQKIAHPNVCRTYDLEELDGSLFVKMEYIAGETLAARHQRLEKMPIAEALAIARAIAAGLEAAHAQHVVHCDLKPENVLIEHGTERVVLMDFGLARPEMRGRVTDARDISGTPAYMAPEQIMGDTVDARTDLYALGCVVYEMVTDEVPYPRATTFDTAELYLQAPVPDPRARRPDLPLWLARAIGRLLAKDPKQRFRSASAVRNALEGPGRLTWRQIAIPALAMTLLICAIGWYRAQRRSSWHPEMKPRLPAYQEIANDPVISPDGQRLAYIANRDGEWRVYVEPLAGGPPQMIVKAGQYLYPIHWTHDGRGVLGISSDARVLRIAIPDGAVEEIARNALAVDDCAGRLIMARSGIEPCPDCVRLVAQEMTGSVIRPKELARLPAGLRVQALRCDRQGQQVAYTAIQSKQSNSTQSDIYVLRLNGGVPRRLTQDGQCNRLPIFAPDGKSIIHLSLRGGSNEFWEIPTEGGEPSPLTNWGRLSVNSDSRMTPADISPDGKILVYNDEFNTLPLSAYRLLDTHERRRVSQTLDNVSYLSPTPDGRAIVVRSARPDKSYAVVLSLSDGHERTLMAADAVAVTPDGRELIYGILGAHGGKLSAMSFADGTERQIAALSQGIDHLTIGPDGWIHFRVGSDEKHMGALKVPLAGGAIVEEEAPKQSLVVPAPMRGWFLVGIPKGSWQYEWQLISPGRSLHGPATRSFRARHAVAWAADGKTFAYWTGTEIRRQDVDTGKDELLLRSSLVDGGIALSPDGGTLYLAEWEGRTTRHMITNFATRPRPVH